MRYYNGKKALSVFKVEKVGAEGSLKKLLDYTKSMRYMFSNTSVSDLTDYIAYEDTAEVVNTEHAFEWCGALKTVPLFDTSKVTTMAYMFNVCGSLESVPAFNTSNVTNMQYMFNNCVALKTVENLDMSKVAIALAMFNGCTELETLRIKNLGVGLVNLSASTKLSVESLRYIIDNAQTLTETQTLTLGATNLAKLTDAEKAVATSKGWTLA